MLHLPGAAGETGRWCALGGLERPRDPTSAGEQRRPSPSLRHGGFLLFNFPLRYLLTIGLVPVFSLRWSLPPALGCIPKQPDSGKTRARRAGGRYRPHTVHGLGLDQKDLGPPRAAPGTTATAHGHRRPGSFSSPPSPKPPRATAARLRGRATDGAARLSALGDNTPSTPDPPRARGTQRGVAATRGKARSGGRRRGVPRAAAGARVPGARPRARLGLGASRPDRAKAGIAGGEGGGGRGSRTRGGGPRMGGPHGPDDRGSPPGARRRDRRRSGTGPSTTTGQHRRAARDRDPPQHTTPGDPKTAGASSRPVRHKRDQTPRRSERLDNGASGHRAPPPREGRSSDNPTGAQGVPTYPPTPTEGRGAHTHNARPHGAAGQPPPDGRTETVAWRSNPSPGGPNHPRKAPRGPAAAPRIPRRAEGAVRARRPGRTSAEDEGGGGGGARAPLRDPPPPFRRRGRTAGLPLAPWAPPSPPWFLRALFPPRAHFSLVPRDQRAGTAPARPRRTGGARGIRSPGGPDVPSTEGRTCGGRRRRQRQQPPPRSAGARSVGEREDAPHLATALPRPQRRARLTGQGPRHRGRGRTGGGAAERRGTAPTPPTHRGGPDDGARAGPGHRPATPGPGTAGAALPPGREARGAGPEPDPPHQPPAEAARGRNGHSGRPGTRPAPGHARRTEGRTA
ncbi:collagen alpha-1(I) chain-like [Neovison vison]|uniref:collagen alpha-1(I) chain-like n=1 Tax=Neovison vison TaxID=452646 RepID=UPI001CF02CB5|nr:collagen alpha-1(I) chain-like [Neogale vison]